MNRATLARLEKLEASLTPPRPSKLFVLSNIGDRGEFIGAHGRFKTDAEMDEEEAALFASGEAQPGDQVDRIIIRIVSPPLRTAGVDRYSLSAHSDAPVGCFGDRTP